MDTWNGRPLNGCLFEAELSDAPVGEATTTDFPDVVDLRQFCSPVEDQQQTNSCTANAVVGALEYHLIRNESGHVDLSRMFAYYNARKLADKQHDDCGSLIHHIIASVMAHGVCEERIWPFDRGNCLLQPPAECYENAMQLQAIQFARTPLGIHAMSALAAGLPVVFGAYLPSAFYQIAAQTGRMPEPGPRLSPVGGGHAMLLVGYDKTSEHWLVRNSYGTAFGEGGYFRIPFATLAAYAVPQHFWTIGAISRVPNLNIRQSDSRQVIEIPSHLDIDLQKLRQQIRHKLEGDLAQAKQGFRDRLRS